MTKKRFERDIKKRQKDFAKLSAVLAKSVQAKNLKLNIKTTH